MFKCFLTKNLDGIDEYIISSSLNKPSLTWNLMTKKSAMCEYSRSTNETCGVLCFEGRKSKLG